MVAVVTSSALSLVAHWPSPLEPTAEFLMQWTPLPVAEFLLTRFSAVARPAALLGALALFMACGGIAALPIGAVDTVRYARSLGWSAATVFMSFVMLYLLRPVSFAPEIALIGAFLGALLLLRMRPGNVSNRRQFLERSGIVLGGAAVLVSLFSLQPVVEVLAGRKLFTFHRAIGLQTEGATELVTPPGQFYINDKVLQYPQVGPPDWRLSLDGAVERAASLDYGALLGLHRESRYITMECVDNPVGGKLIGNALWTGVPVSVLLQQVGARGDTVVFHGVDDYPESTPVRELVERRALIAYGMNGRTLPIEHGFPARLIVPGVYGFKSVKWLTRLEIVHGSRDGTWKSHGWTETAVIHTTTRIDVARREASDVTLAGIAFAGNRGVRAVEVRAQGGAWHRAALGPRLSDETWVQWVIQLRGAGPATFEVRAIDGNGTPQTARRLPAYPNGSSGWATATV